METLIIEIDAFNKTHGLTERQFGELALNDKNLVPQLRGAGGKRPRRLWPETEQRVRDFMSSFVPQSKAA